ncbi:hypothetical protein ASF69_08320 [Rhizobium sp. Leaf311]|nr:hypothetical protein ASF69_08320 [Rhizobium sp. Leaf311]
MPTSVILFGCADYKIDNCRKTSAASSAFFHRMIDFRRHDELPTVLVEHLIDDIANIIIGDVIAAANEHGFLPV